MKKTLQAVMLVVLAIAAVALAATSPHSRANNHFPHEWEPTFGRSINDTGITITKHFFSTNKY